MTHACALVLVFAVGAPCLPAWTPEQTAVAIPMRDGASLAADVYLPAAPRRYPAILIQTPYDRTRMRNWFRPAGGHGIVDRTHYAYVILDWRGFYGSKAAAQGVGLPDYGRDGYDAVEWIARQEWSDGKVGTWGPSALGKVQFMTAKLRPPRLVCCVPVVAAEGSAYEDIFENGVFREAHTKSLVRLGYTGFSLLERVQDSTRVWRLLRRRSDQVAPIDVPMFIITGWYDHSTERHLGTFRALLSSAGPVTRENTKLLVGPWAHVGVGNAEQGALRYDEAAGESERRALQFFDYWLRGQKDNGWDSTPLYTWWQMNESGWKTSEEPAGPATTERTLYLHSDGRMTEQAPAANDGRRAFTSDPKAPVPTVGGANLGRLSGENLLTGPQDQTLLERRDDVLVYTTEPFTEPLRIFDNVKLTFTFSVDRPDASFAVRLCEVWPDGRSMLICDGVTRAKYREGPERAASVKPGEVYTVTLTLPPTAITIGDGRCLRVSIAGSNYPRFELNPNTGADRFSGETAVPVQCIVYHDAARAARMVVPVMR